jgi:anti-anti-sigma factor
VNSQSSLQVLRLAGELELARRDEIRAVLQLDAGRGNVLIDLTGVSYADSSIIAELLRFRGEAGEAGLRVAILIEGGRFARLLQYAGLTSEFAVFEQRAGALNYLTGAGR